MFIGQHARKLDGNYRFKLPGSYIDILKTGAAEPRSMLFAPGEAMRIYSDKGYQALVEAISAQPDNANSRALLRSVISRSERVTFSRLGKARIPQQFVEFFGIERGGQVMLIGCYDYFEIWDWARWQKTNEGVAVPAVDFETAE